jgi:CubicO group peptidase (beta-lactamase class C family)
MSSISSILQPYVDRSELAGAVVAVADEDEVLGLEAVGYCDLEARTSMPTDALFWIASQTKPITATAMMMGVEDGLYDLDDPVEKYIPDFQGQMVIAEQSEERKVLVRPDHPFTIREAMSHTAGLAWTSPLEQPLVPFLTLRQAVLSYTSLPLETQPGSTYQYTNVGINSVARVLEVTSGKPYEDFLQERLFDPLGMDSTTFWPNAEQLARLAKTYRPDETDGSLHEQPLSVLEYPLDDKRRMPSPGGGLFSTTSDLVRFGQMILRGGEYSGKRYLQKSLVEEMTRVQMEPEVGRYGLGWQVAENHFGHGGAYGTNITIYPKEEILTLYMVQHQGFAGEGAGSKEAFSLAAVEQFRGKRPE